MDNIKIFVKNEKELETLIQAIRIYCRNIRIEFGIEKCTILIMKSEEKETTEGLVLQIGKHQSPGKKKMTSTCEYWKRINVKRWKKK